MFLPKVTYVSKENLNVWINEVTLRNGKIISYPQIPMFVFSFFWIYNTLNGHLGHNWQFQFRGQHAFFILFYLFVAFSICALPPLLHINRNKTAKIYFLTFIKDRIVRRQTQQLKLKFKHFIWNCLGAAILFILSLLCPTILSKSKAKSYLRGVVTISSKLANQRGSCKRS